MKNATRLAVAAASAVLALAPAYAGGGHPGPSGGSSGGSSTSGASSTSGSPTSVLEPSDAVLLLIGAGGVVVGRRLHARKRRG